MPEENSHRNDGLLKRFEVGEYIVDLLSGLLLLILFGPLLSAVKYVFAKSCPCDSGDPVLAVFPEALQWIADKPLSSFTPWLVLGIAAVLGTVSRSVLILYNLFPPARLLEKLICFIARWQVGLWHQLAPGWERKDIASRLINQSPFHRIGGKAYASDRAELLNTSGERRYQNQYWYYEMPLYLRSAHFYSLFYTFFWTYLIGGGIGYGYIYFWKACPFSPLGFRTWLLILFLTLLLVIGLFEEVIIHGAAFVAIDDVLRDKDLSETPRR